MKGELFILEYIHQLARLITNYFFLFLFTYLFGHALEYLGLMIMNPGYFAGVFVANLVLGKDVRKTWKFLIVSPFDPESYRDPLKEIVDKFENPDKITNDPKQKRKELLENPLSG